MRLQSSQQSQASQASEETQASEDAASSQSFTIEKLSADVTYEKREATFNGRAIDGGRTLEAKGSALLQDGRQEVRLASASLAAAGITWKTRDNAEAMLVHDGTSPLYTPQISDVALNRRLIDVVAAL